MEFPGHRHSKPKSSMAKLSAETGCSLGGTKMVFLTLATARLRQHVARKHPPGLVALEWYAFWPGMTMDEESTINIWSVDFPDPVFFGTSASWWPRAGKADYPRCLLVRATGTELTLKNSKSNKVEYVWSTTETRKATEKRIRKTLDDWVFCKYATMAILAFSWVRGDNELLKAILLVVRWLAIWSNGQIWSPVEVNI